MRNIPLTALLLAASCTLASSAFSETTASPADSTSAKQDKNKSYFFSSLLPKALQAHPLLTISVITEVTDLGKKITPPTANKPAYYLIKSMGYHHEGQGVYEEGKVAIENIERIVRNSLASSHYLPADKEHPATLCLFYFWGIHSKLDNPDQETGMGGTPDIGYKNLLARAQLVGGAKFAKEFEAALKSKHDSMSPGDNKMIGIDPVYMFTMRTDLNRSLMDQVLDDCYYVVVSAYDAGALVGKGERKLLWRTKISTAAQGVSIAETTPTLVTSGGAFFGRDMKEAMLVDKRINRKGSVETGELKVLEMDGKSETTPPANK
ncbi:MAG: hypothetical protein QM790_14155 [Nibricoccus sp.]